MIIRTYSRRNKVTDSSYDEDKEIKFSGSLPHQSPRDIRNFEFSSQDSTPWSVEVEPCNNSKKSFSINGFEGQISPKAKKPRNTDMETGGRWTCMPVLAEELHDEPLVSTATLMETQEFGELMENLDEVHFALDGLRKGLPLRIRRASLLSLLSISSTVQKRRLLRNQGTAERIIEAVLGLAFDDMSSSLAAAALLFLFTSDAKDDHLLESSSGISFLLELLKPIKSKGPKCKGSTIGCKLLAVLKNPKVSHAATDDMDPNISSINFKVQEILVNSKELKSISGIHSITGRPELDPKWLALLTMEKASLSKISLEV